MEIPAMIIIVIGTGSASVLQDRMSLGTLFIFITYISSFFELHSGGFCHEQFGTFAVLSLAPSGKSCFSILDEKPQIVKPKNLIQPEPRDGLNLNMFGLPMRRKIIY